jgi:hypothetical protein
MPAIGIGITWFGYSVALWGYCLLRGYDVKFTDLVNPLHPWAGKWPPPTNIPADQILPGQVSGGVAQSGGPTSAPQVTGVASQSVTGTVGGSRL